MKTHLEHLRTEPFTIHREWTESDIPVLRASVSLPEPVPALNAVCRRIRRYYRLQGRAFLRYCQRTLLPMAQSEARAALAESRPLPEFQAELSYEITYNAHGFWSLYTQVREHTLPGQDFLLVDTVSYYNLLQGEYRLIGTLMDRATGKEFLADGKPVTAEKIFTAGSANGQETVAFAFRAENIEGKSLVAFEKLYKRVKKADGSITETEIAKHEDLSDDWQTVTIGKKPEEPEKPGKPEKPEKPKKPKKPRNPQEVPKTGDAANAAGYLLLLAGATAGLVFSTGMLRKRRKTNR